MPQTAANINRSAILAALQQTDGQIAPAALLLGVHRATLHRWLANDERLAQACQLLRQARAEQNYAMWKHAREAKRAKRQAELLPIYQANAAHAREAKQGRR